MPADPYDKPVLRTPEVEEIEFEVMDENDAGDGAGSVSAADVLKMGPDMIVNAFRSMLRERLKRWFIRSLFWGGGLGLLATEHTWAKWAFGFWAFIAGAHLAFLLYGWYASGKQKEKLMRIFGGMMPPGSGPGR